MLESAGIATALVDYPEHVFVLLDTGVPRTAAYQLPVDERLYVARGEGLWVPVEVTQIGESFAAATDPYVTPHHRTKRIGDIGNIQFGSVGIRYFIYEGVTFQFSV